MSATPRTHIRLHLMEQDCIVHRLYGEEALNTPSWFRVLIPRGDLTNDLDALMNQPVLLSIGDSDSQNTLRRIRLQVQSIKEDWPDGTAWYNLALGSKLNQGHHQRQTRLFMGQTREQVLHQLLAEMGYATDEIDLALDPVPAHAGPFLQAGESTLHCFHRLLAEVGANYWFEPPEGDGARNPSERLVIRNDTQISPYLPRIEWAQSVSGLSPDEQLNRITRARGHWHSTPGVVGHAVADSRPGALSNDSATHQRFEPPRPRNEAEQRALFEQQYYDQQRFTLELHSHQPLLAAGYSVALDAHSLPRTIKSGDYRLLKVSHWGEPTGTANPKNAGLAYRNTAEARPRSTSVRPKRRKPKNLPQIFPARIESRHDHAQLSPEGHYRLRYDFDTSDRAQSQASAPIERLAPYGGPKNKKTGLAVGWHFPLIDQTTVLVSCLNNDPARPLVLGYVPSTGQVGPVKRNNRTQSRLVTPGQNELTFDDKINAERIALHTFDGQVCLELNAKTGEHYSQVLAQFGGIHLYAGDNLYLETKEGNLQERIGADRVQTIKNNSLTKTEEGAIHHQAQTDQIHTAQMHFTQSAGNDFSLWVQKKSLNIKAKNGETTTVKLGDAHIQVNGGSVVYEVNGDITVKGNGQGDILFKQGDSGFKIDKDGDVKIFGPKITLKGQSGVVFNGEVQYEAGAANEPESAAELSLPELPEATLLEDDRQPGITAVAWQEDTLRRHQETQLNVSHRSLTEGAELTLTFEQINPDGTTETIDTQSHPVTEANGTTTISWTAPEHLAQSQPLEENMPIQPFRYRFKAECEGAESDWSQSVQLNVDLRLHVRNQNGIALPDGTQVEIQAADGQVHPAIVQDGTLRVDNVASGPVQLRTPSTRHN